MDGKAKVPRKESAIWKLGLSERLQKNGQATEALVRSSTVNSLRGCDITRRMQHPVHDEKLFMEEALAAIRRAMTEEEVGEMTLAPAEPRTSREQVGAKPIPGAGLLSHHTSVISTSMYGSLPSLVRASVPFRAVSTSHGLQAITP